MFVYGNFLMFEEFYIAMKGLGLTKHKKSTSNVFVIFDLFGNLFPLLIFFGLFLKQSLVSL